MAEYLETLKGALEQASGWLDEAIACARRGDRAGAAENVDDALPWLKTAAGAAEKLTGGSSFAEQLGTIRQNLIQMQQPYDVAALVEAHLALEQVTLEIPDDDGEEGDDEDDAGAVEEVSHVAG